MNHKYKIVDVPPVSPGGRRTNPALLKLIDAVAELPNGKAILVTPEMLGSANTGEGYAFRGSLSTALKQLGAPVRVAQRAGSVYVMRAEVQGGRHER